MLAERGRNPPLPKANAPHKPTIIEEKRINQFGIEERIQYLKGNFLGKGGFATCYELQDMTTGKIYAGKMVAKSTLTKPRAVQKLKAEIRIQKSLDHKHIVKLEKYFEDSQYVYILLEMCNQKSMMDLLKKRKHLTEPEARYYLLQILESLKYMHKRKVIHRDLKLGNLFLHNMEVKLGDFGLATQLEFEGERKKTLCGTPNYIAPEILMGRAEGHSFEVDIWAVGVILFTLLVGQPPFETSDVQTTYSRIRANRYSFPPNCPLSPSVKELIRLLLQPLPEQRPSLSMIDRHEWVRGPVPSHLSPSTLRAPPSRAPLTDRTNFLEKVGSDPSKSSHTSAPPKGPKSGDPLKENSQPFAPPLRSVPMGSPKKSVPKDRGEGPGNVVASMHKTLSQSFAQSHSVPSDVAVTSPSVWVGKWVDYSNMYGLGYVLSDGTLGAFFNDSSKLFHPPDGGLYHYLQPVHSHGKRSEERTLFSARSEGAIPQGLQKKVTLLKYFHTYLSQHSRDTETVPVGSGGVVYVQKWLRTKHAIVFRLSNQTVQVNFFDHWKVMLSSEAQVVTFQTPEKTRETFLLHSLAGNPSHASLLIRLKYVRDILLTFSSDKSKPSLPPSPSPS